MTSADQFSFAILSLPLITALIGWVTNYIAVKMLFHPVKPVNLGFFSMQGVLPRRQADIAVQFGHMVATDLLSCEELIARLTNKRSREIYKDFIDTESEKFIRKLAWVVPAILILLRSRILTKVKDIFADEMLKILPDLVGQLTNTETGSLQVQQLVASRVRAFPTSRLEAMFNEMLAKEFRFIEILGAVLGFVIGLFQLLLLLIVR